MLNIVWKHNFLMPTQWLTLQRSPFNYTHAHIHTNALIRTHIHTHTRCQNIIIDNSLAFGLSKLPNFKRQTLNVKLILIILVILFKVCLFWVVGDCKQLAFEEYLLSTDNHLDIPLWDWWNSWLRYPHFLIPATPSVENVIWPPGGSLAKDYDRIRYINVIRFKKPKLPQI